jgi:hypothetical protein
MSHSAPKTRVNALLLLHPNCRPNVISRTCPVKLSKRTETNTNSEVSKTKPPGAGASTCGRQIEVARLRITDARREALTQEEFRAIAAVTR